MKVSSLLFFSRSGVSTVVSFAKIRPLFSTFTKIARKKMFNPNPIFPSKKDFSDSGNEVMPLNVV